MSEECLTVLEEFRDDRVTTFNLLSVVISSDLCPHFLVVLLLPLRNTSGLWKYNFHSFRISRNVGRSSGSGTSLCIQTITCDSGSNVLLTPDRDPEWNFIIVCSSSFRLQCSSFFYTIQTLFTEMLVKIHVFKIYLQHVSTSLGHLQVTLFSFYVRDLLYYTYRRSYE
jgi:hypothetical protein